LLLGGRPANQWRQYLHSEQCQDGRNDGSGEASIQTLQRPVRLVGIQIFYTDHSDDTSTDTDMNVLTGDVIEKKSKGDGKPKIVKRKKRFGLSLLKDFDFSNSFGTSA